MMEPYIPWVDVPAHLATPSFTALAVTRTLWTQESAREVLGEVEVGYDTIAATRPLDPQPPPQPPCRVREYE